MPRLLRPISVSLVGAVLLWAGLAQGERDLSRPQESAWLGQQYAILSALTLANVAAFTVGPPARAAALDVAYFGEGNVVENDSAYTDEVSDVTLFSSVLLPVATLSAGGGTAWGNSLLVYTEAIEASLLTNTVVKRLVRRARPYTRGPVALERLSEAGADAFYSFYSGHSAMAFSAATASSVLFSSISSRPSWAAAHFGAAFALAGLTAHARVRAGKHYPSDVFVGSVAGIAWGLLVPAAHGLDLGLSPTNLGAAAGGLAAGFLSALLLPRSAPEVIASLVPRVTPLPGGVVVQLEVQQFLRATAAVN